jgi:hypothetical protein
MKKAFLLLALTLAGCLSVEQRELLIEDISVARQYINTTLPPGPTKDKMLARLTAAQTAEELLQVRAAVRAAAANATPATQPAK